MVCCGLCLPYLSLFPEDRIKVLLLILDLQKF